MEKLAKPLSYIVIGVIVFYGAMFFFVESLPLPYRVMPDAMKIERMIAAETMECMIADDADVGAGLFLLGVSKSDLVRLAVSLQTREQLLAERDSICPDVAKQ